MIICFDTETTGLNSDDEIIQLSIADAATGKELLNEYFRPSDNLIERGWDEAAAVTGITPELVSNCASLSDAIIHELIQEIIDSADIIIGYHVAYDVAMMERAGFNMRDHLYQDPMYGFAYYYWSTHSEEKHVTKRGKVMDPFMKWKDNVDGGKGQYINKSLVFAADFFGISEFGAHDSMNDVIATINVWERVSAKQREAATRTEIARNNGAIGDKIVDANGVECLIDERGCAMVTPLGDAFSYMRSYTREQLAVLDA